MGHKEPMTIASALRQIQDRKLILPAIQREYVWKPSQIIRVFDSVMRGYPVGSFLSWKVLPETIDKFKFYGFMMDYSAFDNRHNPVIDIPTDREVVAILDGQQRLTSLNIGLRGTYAYKNHGGWANKSWSYPERRLHLNLASEAPENELGLKYHFQFLTKHDVDASAGDETKKWMPVSEVFDASDTATLIQLLARHEVGNDPEASALVSKLWEAVHKTASLQFYEEEDQDIERVLDIFVRVNSGGTVLSYSDLLLSIATAQWKGDARAAVHGLVDGLNQTGNGFNFSRDTILKSGLMMADVRDIGFKVKNFTTTNMTKLETGWDDMSKSLQVAVGLLSDFGLSGGSLTVDSVLIPVAYYVHHRGLEHSYRESPKSREDRDSLRSWVLRSLIVRGVWGSGLDTLLRDLREVIQTQGASAFPVAAIERAMSRRGKPLTVTDALVDDVLSLSYGKARTFAVLAALFPHVDTRNQFHVDHVFPSALLDRKALRSQINEDGTARFTPDEIDDLLDLRDRLPNLELLPGLENIGKSDKIPELWLAAEYPSSNERSAFLERNALPQSLPLSVDEFKEFCDERGANLTARIHSLLETQIPDPSNTNVTVLVDLDEELSEGDDSD
ncbi:MULTISPECIES: DUF262 domain-containing protein [Micrococcaceae]|uniref:GmrSD restriction endonucleases N-terminal domain-containing protein n=1 Tax=Arthrobacter rhombi TaxID=71253 RepID=A0A1R4FMW6_9MICC|nr:MULTISPECIES: DUF262 domain-containing protein [Micrococcaceae]PCC25356.1 DUF262 domain-containing protein [Glutamicibacter sp. BW78]SJM57256.1 hypothetical protein FM101_04845 [Arthrobacter rhombi]